MKTKSNVNSLLHTLLTQWTIIVLVRRNYSKVFVMKFPCLCDEIKSPRTKKIVYLLSLKSILEIKKENLNNKICKYMNLTITSYKQKLVAEKSQENAKENTCSDAPAGIV